MGLFDVFKHAVESEVRHTTNRAVNHAVHDAVQGTVNAAVDGVANIGKGKNKDEKFIFNSLPTSVAELQALPEITLDSAFKTTALTLAVLCNYEKNPEETFAMLDVLKGPEPLNPSEKQFIKERLTGKNYIAYSYFKGATVENNYTPSAPFTITVSENPYSFDNENWATMYVTSAGADSPRQVKLRKKPSTNQWFLNDIQCLSDIRTPKDLDPWA